MVNRRRRAAKSMTDGKGKSGEEEGLRRRGPSLKPANYIRAWREFRGITSQGQMALKAGMTRPTISRLESGAMPYRQKALEQLARVLECTPSDLIGSDPNAMGAIFQIYERIPESLRPQALSALVALVPKKP